MFRTGFRPDRLSVVSLSSLGVAVVLVLGGCSGSGADPGAEAAENSNSAALSENAGASGDITASSSVSPRSTPATTGSAYKPGSAEGPAENVPVPVMPELAKQESKEGLEAFVMHWFALINYGYETGDVEAARATSGTSCNHCEGYFGAMEKGYEDDDWIVGGTLDLRGVGTEYIQTPENRYQVIVSVAELPSVYLGAGGVVYGEKPGSEYSFAQIIEASYINGAWAVESVDTFGS